jgi:hypothetical protein
MIQVIQFEVKKFNRQIVGQSDLPESVELPCVFASQGCGCLVRLLIEAVYRDAPYHRKKAFLKEALNNDSNSPAGHVFVQMYGDSPTALLDTDILGRLVL